MRTKFYLLIFVAMSVFSVAAKQLSAADIIGKWKYLISDVPPEYESGFFTFEEKDGKTVGYAGEDAEKQELTEIAVDQGKVSFVIESGAGVFKYNFAQSGDTLTGIVSSQYGDFPIKAIREVKK